MSSRDRVIVGYDGSKRARSAVRWAAHYAQLSQRPLTIVRVRPVHPVPTRTGIYRAMQQGVDFSARVNEIATRQLAEARDAVLANAPDLEVGTELITGDSAGALVELSDTAHAVVVGRTGASGISGALLGGTAAGVIHHAQGNVIVVPHGVKRVGDGPILLGVDDADDAETVARAAVGEAAKLQRPLLAVHCVDLDAALGVEATSLQLRDESSFVTDYLDRLERLTEGADKLDTRIVTGRAERVLTKLSDEGSLLVVGNRGRGGFAGLLLGSVARALVAHAHCPILVTRTQAVS